ncbi:hypothetical protein [Streptomyces canus]|uniref:hypothetical protein n=1 Tax=Streptomyces canus TaxID=58343 RepID=UPI00371FEFB9
MPTTRQGPPGLDLARLVAGGKSNLTYEVSDGEATGIVRRPFARTCAHDGP